MSQNKHTAPAQKNWLKLIIFAFIAVSIAVAGFFAWQKHQISQEKEALAIAIENQKQALIELQKREQVGERMKAAEILNKAQSYRTNWSEVVADLNNAFLERSSITFQQVSASADGEISVEASSQDLLGAAGFLVLINRSDLFENGFISQISPKGESSEYSFSATFNRLAPSQQ